MKICALLLDSGGPNNNAEQLSLISMFDVEEARAFDERSDALQSSNKVCVRAGSCWFACCVWLICVTAIGVVMWCCNE